MYTILKRDGRITIYDLQDRYRIVWKGWFLRNWRSYDLMKATNEVVEVDQNET